MSASARNRREAATVDWLIDRLAMRLGDRQGGRHAAPWEPKQEVLLGVLEPIRVIEPPVAEADRPGESSDGTVPEPPSTPATAETAKRPSGEIPSIGLDFRLRTPAGATTVALDLDVAFAVYPEELATLEEQRSYLGARADGDEKAPDTTAPSGGESKPEQPSAADTSSAGVEPTGADAQPPAPAGRKRRERKARVLGAWRRRDVTLDTLQIELPLDGQVLTVGTPLVAPVAAIIDAHYTRPDAMRPFTGKRNELSPAALADSAAFDAAVAAALDPNWKPRYPDLELTAFAQRVGPDEYLVSVALRNTTTLGERTQQDLSMYDCELSIHPGSTAQIVPQRFDLAPDDYRMADLADVIGRGTSCVAVPTEAGGLRSETLPTHVQNVIEPRGDHVATPRWSELAADPTAILTSIQVAMEDYHREYERSVASAAGQAHHAEAQKGLEQFADELRRFRLGRQAMKDDPRLAQSFRLANEVFAIVNAGKRFDTWRLFQLVYIVTHLPALAARELNDPEMRAELEFVDVLWFPAGGGKTEAYLGLIVTALFYDRLRGKDAGVTSWLRFPLRMLSVQQLARMMRVLVVAEDLRRIKKVGSDQADPFALAYLVGGGGTPNTLRWEATWWKGWEAEAKRAAKGTFVEDHLPDRLVTRCPYCQQDEVVLNLDVNRVRIVHQCTACGRELPLYMSDEEVYRALPAVVISTVDKLTGYTWFGEYTGFSHGPRYQCPQHGYYSFPNFGSCLVGPDLCPPIKKAHPAAASVKDPVPALTIQDEMHLLKEELGAFSGHYEGLIAELQRGGPSGMPSKVLAASATIEQFEDQLRQVYGRRPRAFPSAGYERERTFYTQQTPDARRTFVGVLPHYRRKADVAAIVQAEMLRSVTEAQDETDPLTALALDPDLWEATPSRDSLLDLLFNYEVSLGYVNSKAHGAKLDEELRLLSDRLDSEGRGPVERVVLTGQVPIPDLAEAIGRVQDEKRTAERSGRLRAMVGTSVVSHGVDLDRLNVLIMAGMPTTAADYIQVTARSGRTYAGLVVTVYDTFSRRERSLFSNFASYHTFLDQMVTPVPVNKYAFFVADRTVPGIALALLHDLARNSSLNPPDEGVRIAKSFQAWWNARRTAIDAVLQPRLRRCYETPIKGVNDPAMERELADRAMRAWVDTESKALSRPAEEKQTSRLFHQAPLSNFRDIDEPAEFQVFNPSMSAFEAVTGRRAPADNDTGDAGSQD